MKKKGFVAEFKEFISRGSVMDLAVGIIIGTAFTAIINSLVNDVIMPVLGRIISGVNFAQLKVVLVQAVGDTAEVAINYGIFIQKVIDFLLIALVVFMLVRQINRFRRKKEEPAMPASEPVVSDEVKLLTEIRDLLKK